MINKWTHLPKSESSHGFMQLNSSSIARVCPSIFRAPSLPGILRAPTFSAICAAFVKIGFVPFCSIAETMSAASVVPNQDSIGSASVQNELFRFRNPVLLRTERGTITYIRSHQIQRRERIFLNIYHLQKCLNTTCFKCCCMGVFHSGIEMFGAEFAFGGSSESSTGIFFCSPMHSVSSRHFGEQFELLSSTCVGYSKMTPTHLTKLIDMISPEWPANSYNLISRNCNHFVESFLAQIACRRQLPSFVNRCSRLAVSVQCCLPKFITSMNFSSPSDV
jgi:hypothetical protein